MNEEKKEQEKSQEEPQKKVYAKPSFKKYERLYELGTGS